MFFELVALLSQIVMNLINSLGYGGVFLAMLVESVCLPLPSEVIMPFAGFLAATGQFNFWLVVLMGAFGNLVGSLLAYVVGYYGGAPLVIKYGKYFFIRHQDYLKAENWFIKYGSWAIFTSRLLPIVRTFISLPAGVAKMPIRPFIGFTFLGCFLWSLLLTYIGYVLGENWVAIHQVFSQFDYAIIVAIILAVAYYIYRHYKKTN